MEIETGGPDGPVVSLSATFAAPVSRVWAAWTDPEQIARWFFASDGYSTNNVTSDLAELGRFTIDVRPPEGDVTEIRGFHIEVSPPDRLISTWRGTMSDEQYWTLVDVRIEPLDGGARLSLVHGMFECDSDRALHEQAWLSSLQSLGNYLETSSR